MFGFKKLWDALVNLRERQESLEREQGLDRRDIRNLERDIASILRHTGLERIPEDRLKWPVMETLRKIKKG